MNLTNYTQFIPYFITAFICTLIFTPIIGRIAEKYNILDLPAKLRPADDETAPRRIHTEPKPLLGGVSVVATFVILAIFFVKIDTSLKYFLFGTFSLLLLGILDDIYKLSAKVQLIVQVFAAFLMIYAGKSIDFINNPFDKGAYIYFNQIPVHVFSHTIYLVSAAITLFWIVFIINSVKWIAGTDGLVEGNMAIVAVVIALLSVRLQTFPTAGMGFILAGALLGFLPYNFYPSKIFSGSSGKSVYGYIIAVLAIYSGAKLATAILALSLPVIDALFVIVTRIREKHPKNIFQLMSINDKNHLHHKLLNLGFSQRQIAGIEYLITLIFGIFALTLTGMHKTLALFIAGCIILLSLILITRAQGKKIKQGRKTEIKSPEKKFIY